MFTKAWKSTYHSITLEEWGCNKKEQKSCLLYSTFLDTLNLLEQKNVFKLYVFSVFPLVFQSYIPYTSSLSLLSPLSCHLFPLKAPAVRFHAQKPPRTGPSKGTSGYILPVLTFLADANSDNLLPPWNSLLSWPLWDCPQFCCKIEHISLKDPANSQTSLFFF